MFSYSGLSAAQVDRLREEHGVYAVSSGRICVAALNSGNIDKVANRRGALSLTPARHAATDNPRCKTDPCGSVLFWRLALAFFRYVPRMALYICTVRKQRIIAMASKLTERQQQILDLIRQNRRAHGLSAHPRRNCPGAGFPLPNAAEDHLKALAPPLSSPPAPRAAFA